MKVKNIAFSGFMAAILMGVTGAHAAINVASQAYVDGKLKNKADVAAVTTLEGNVSTLSQTVADNKSATDAAIQANAEAIALKADQSALEELSSTVAGLDGTYATDVELAAEKAALQEQIAGVVAGDMKEALAAYATNEYVNQQDTALSNRIATLEGVDNLTQAEADAALALKADKTQVATDIASAITSANNYTDAEIAKLTAEDGAITAAQAKADSAYELADAAQTAGEVQDAITGAITGLDLGNTYEAKGTAAGLDAALKTELQGEIQTAQSAAEAKVTELAEGAVATNTAAIAANTAAIANKQDTLNANQLLATNSGITAEKVSSYDTAVSELANKISMPEACKQANGNCVLGIMNQKVQWINLTEPVDDEQPEA